ncbi:helix-turn-helix domain-containing protein [Streptomyces sp. NPDC087437]|uniref:helix-turn-helix domain-containing protein n=1 Tax=Streptomyces sp. NPDC087437 TaxID=3365789 RepID=UPI00381163F5
MSSRDVPADIATRGRIVLWSAEGRRRKDIAELLGVSLPTVDRWKRRYAEHGVAGLEGGRPGGGREQVPARVRARVIALTRMTPPDGTGLSHWSTRELAKYLKRTEDVEAAGTGNRAAATVPVPDPAQVRLPSSNLVQWTPSVDMRQLPAPKLSPHR